VLNDSDMKALTAMVCGLERFVFEQPTRIAIAVAHSPNTAAISANTAPSATTIPLASQAPSRALPTSKDDARPRSATKADVTNARVETDDSAAGVRRSHSFGQVQRGSRDAISQTAPRPGVERYVNRGSASCCKWLCERGIIGLLSSLFSFFLNFIFISSLLLL
jgi:hypothetical protein